MIKFNKLIEKKEPIYIRIEMGKSKTNGKAKFKVSNIFDDEHGVVKRIKDREPDGGAEFISIGQFGGQIYINPTDDINKAKEKLKKKLNEAVDNHIKTIKEFKTQLEFED